MSGDLFYNGECLVIPNPCRNFTKHFFGLLGDDGDSVNALEFLRANDTNFDITPKTALNNQKNYIYARRDEINDIIYKVSGLEEFFRSGN
jgi:hypothetical protein